MRELAAVVAGAPDGLGGSLPDSPAPLEQVDVPAQPASPSMRAPSEPDVPGGPASPQPDSEPAPRHLRRLPRPGDLQRSRHRMVVALGALAVAGVLLTVTGVNLVWTSTAGRYVSPGLLPDDPDYVALVTPTPTLLVVGVNEDGEELVGATLVSLHAGDQGGAVIVLPVATTIPPLDDDEAAPVPGSGEDGERDDPLPDEGVMTLDEAYAEAGAAGVRAGVERIFRVAVAETIEVDDAGWVSLLSPVEPLSLVVPDPVGDEWPAGPLELGAEDAGEFLAATVEGESELNRVARQELFWQAWVPAVTEAGARAVPGEPDAGLGRFLIGLAAGELAVTGLPVVPASEDSGDGDSQRFTVEPAVIADIVARDVPYPQEPWAGSRVRVKLLNGTSDADLLLRAAAPLVRAQAEMAIMGNAGSFEEPRTRIVYRDDSQRQAARALRDALGVGVVEQEPDREDPRPVDEGERVDVTVILGGDASQAIGRLETTD